jgi:two-component system, NarL family, response regulator LiaR
MIRVLIADDHEVVRQGLRFVLEQEEDIDVVGECADGLRVIARLAALQPEVLLLDMVMPGADGLAVLDAIRSGSARWQPAVIVLTSFQEDERVIAAIRAGALSYLPKTTAVDRVVAAVRAAAHGDSVLDPGTAALLIRHVRDGASARPLDVLSARERDVLAGLARGKSNRQIARALTIGEETVKTHVSSILAKLGLSDRTQAAIFGLQQGLVPLDSALD